MARKVNRRGLVLTGLAAPLFSGRAAADPDLLPPDQAFKMRPGGRSGQTLEILFLAAPGYYLYAEKFRFETDNKAVRVTSVELPPGQTKWEEEFSKTITYFRGLVRVKVTLDGPQIPVKLTAHAQGCADAGVCYQPVSRTFEVPGVRS